MDTNDYLNSMKHRLSNQYDIYEGYEINGFHTDIYAHYYIRNERYIASKSATLYAYESNEHTFFRQHHELDIENTEAFVASLKESIDDFVDPHDEHMSTRLNAVFVVDSELSPDLKRFIEKFKYQKAFLFGLKGWVDICLIAVSMNTGEVVVSKKARNMKSYYRPLTLQ